ncbi:protein stum homolog [Macrobrachium nipponense]|uniref:protein stum homolog n=1 Tax=Macrobrachium nipponense TaxID=159736 RepID=UPI0030C89E6C
MVESDQAPLKHQGSKLLHNAGIGIEKRRRSSLATNYRIENNKVIIENEDGTVQELEIVSSKEKQGKLRKAVPALPLGFAITCLILNIIPGLGTFVSGFGVLCGYESNLQSKASTIFWNIVTALLQLLLAPIIIGWVWSLHRGVLIVQEALDKKMRSRQQQQQQESHGCPA